LHAAAASESSERLLHTSIQPSSDSRSSKDDHGPASDLILSAGLSGRSSDSHNAVSNVLLGDTHLAITTSSALTPLHMHLGKKSFASTDNHSVVHVPDEVHRGENASPWRAS
jgi:hypothetical protein